jgi:hypothetical protein
MRTESRSVASCPRAGDRGWSDHGRRRFSPGHSLLRVGSGISAIHYSQAGRGVGGSRGVIGPERDPSPATAVTLGMTG